MCEGWVCGVGVWAVSFVARNSAERCQLTITTLTLPPSRSPPLPPSPHQIQEQSAAAGGQYVAYHIRRGDFQHKHTQLSAQQILDNTLAQVQRALDSTATGASDAMPSPKLRDLLVYISTDETNRTFFEPFSRVFRGVFFLGNFTRAHRLDTDLDQNHIGMVEQVICASAHTFIGTPLSTFTGYISRMRGYKNKTLPGIYSRTYYFMQKQMHQLHNSPHLSLPFWPREFVEAFDDMEF